MEEPSAATLASHARDVAAKALEQGRIVHLAIAGEGGGAATQVERVSILSAPLAARGRTLGTITLVSSRGRGFPDIDVNTIQRLAQLAALALDNARLLHVSNDARLAAEQAGRAKDRFLAMLSHELRTPLTPALLAVSGLLDDPSIPGELRGPLEAARRGIALEARLVDDLLDVTRIASGKLQIRPERVDLHHLARQAVAACAEKLREAGLALLVRLEAERAIVDADPVRIQQVIWNLLENAAKFSPRGGRVTLSTRRRRGWNHSADLLALEVADTGIGIERELLGRVFDVFVQGGEERRRRSGGLGLGLAISRSIAEAHGGRLTAESEGSGRGARFTLEIPAASIASLPREHPATPLEAAPSALSILLVEDDAATCQVLGRLLGRRGALVTNAASCEEAARAAANASFDLLICDLGLPDGDGLSLPERLGFRGRVPALALTGYGSEDDVLRTQAAGFQGHLTKPVDFRQLEEEIGRVAREFQAPPAR